jgi:hypothetical protein
METQVIEKSVSTNLPKLETTYPQSRVHGRVITTKIVGVTFEGRQEVVARLQMGDRVWIEPEPSNPYDPNAIKVCRSNGEQIGYFSRYLAASVAPYFKAYSYPVKGKVTLLTGSGWGNYSLGVVIAFKLPKLTNHKNGNPELDWDDWED